MITANECILTEEYKEFLENYIESIMNGCKEENQNCNYCIYRKDVSRHLDMEDYCSLNKKNICMIRMDIDCPLKKLENKSIQ